MQAALLIIDVQIGLVRLVQTELQDSVLPKIAVLLSKARSSGILVLFIQHDAPKRHPLETNSPAWAIHPAIAPLCGESGIGKKASDSFFETGLAGRLRTDGLGRVIIAGGMTEYCVDTTCRRAVTLGYDVTLVADAHLTRDTPILTAAQIIAHHYLLLEGFAVGIHAIKVTPASEISL
ncbi:MAG: hypothetical protein QOF94_1308 [Acidobacteriaceae bacterium]